MFNRAHKLLRTVEVCELYLRYIIYLFLFGCFLSVRPTSPIRPWKQPVIIVVQEIGRSLSAEHWLLPCQSSALCPYAVRIRCPPPRAYPPPPPHTTVTHRGLQMSICSNLNILPTRTGNHIIPHNSIYSPMCTFIWNRNYGI